jgi:hypothetical protein
MATPWIPETRIRKTNPEQTLSVPVVFCNRLKFNEFVKAAEIIPRLQADLVDDSIPSPRAFGH